VAEPEFLQQATAENPEGSTIPHGGAQQLEEAFDIEADTDEFGEELDEDDFEDVEDEADFDLGAPTGNDALLFGPSNRPFEPLTAGAPFGAGPDRTTRLDDDMLVRRFVDEMAARPDAPDEVKNFAQRVRRGE
jgi:hypothetical protein